MQAAFMHALEWAWHLGLPIHAWALPGRLSATSISDDLSNKVSSCIILCAEWGVKLGLTRIEGAPSHWFERHLQPEDLLILSCARARTERRTLVRHVLQQSAAVLFCPTIWQGTLSRLLVLYRNCEQNRQTLATALQLCRCIRTTPVVLTVARSEREGRRLQQPARAALVERRQQGNFDLVIGADVAEAAARVARWRQCQLLVMGRHGRLGWAHWLGGGTTERLIGLADSFAVLTIPKQDVFDRGDDSGNTRMALAETLPGRTSRVEKSCTKQGTD